MVVGNCTLYKFVYVCMGTLKLHDLYTPREEIVKERDNRFLKLSSAENFMPYYI